MQEILKNPYDLIDVFLFDLDGTLVDTVPSLKSAYYAFLGNFNKEGSEAEFEIYNGSRIQDIVVQLQKTHSLPGTPENLFELYSNKIAQIPQQENPLRLGARELLEYLRSTGAKCGVVTSASEAYASNILKFHGIEGFFDVVVGGDSIKNPKPDPEPYVTAVKFLNSNAERALAIEDSPHGIASAVKARIKCIGISPIDSRHDSLYASGAFEVVSSMVQIRSIAERFRHVRPTVYSASSLAIVEDTKKRERATGLDKRVELYWEGITKAHNHLFDGSAVFLRSTEKFQKQLTIYVGSCPYRYIVAGCCGMVTGIEGLAVTGIVVTDMCGSEGRRYLIGKRSQKVLQHPGCWEFVPSGAIDLDARKNGSLDPEVQLVRELKEEVYLESSHIVSVEFLGLIRDINYKVADLCYMIKLNSAIVPTLRSESAEYTQIKTVSYDELQGMIQDESIKLVPMTQALMMWAHQRLSK